MSLFCSYFDGGMLIYTIGTTRKIRVLCCHSSVIDFR